MTYPAFSALFNDPERTVARICVYMALQPPFLSHAVPRDVKLEVVSRRAKVRPGTASKAIAWLIQRGYLVVHTRDRRGMASMTLAYHHDFRAETVQPNDTMSSAQY